MIVAGNFDLKEYECRNLNSPRSPKQPQLTSESYTTSTPLGVLYCTRRLVDAIRGTVDSYQYQYSYEALLWDTHAPSSR